MTYSPWQRSGAVSPPTPSVKLSDIIRAESEHKSNLDKAKNKTLAQIQVLMNDILLIHGNPLLIRVSKCFKRMKQ